jgi:hypothetical protein
VKKTVLTSTYNEHQATQNENLTKIFGHENHITRITSKDFFVSTTVSTAQKASEGGPRERKQTLKWDKGLVYLFNARRAFTLLAGPLSIRSLFVYPA